MEFEVTSSPETALKKLAKANIAVYKLKKSGFKLRFGVRQEYTQKVFAIFSHSCYNTVIIKKSWEMRLASFAKRRFGIILGGALFLAACALSSNVIFKIKVVGNGGYLSEQITSIARECGADEWSFCRGLDAPLLQSKVMALPGVNFCSVQRAGSYLLIDVHTEDEHTVKLDYKPLASPLSGEVYSIVAICGTPLKVAGDKIAAGEQLIAAYEVSADGSKTECLAVGFAYIKAQASLSLFYESESESNAQSALKAAQLYSDKILESGYTVAPCDGGVNYKVTFTYLIAVAANME